jgi:hypothetical protein
LKRENPVSPARHGIDAPYLLPVPVVLIVANIVNGVLARTAWPFVAAVIVIACMACGLYASRRGKFVVWSRLLGEPGPAR